MRPPKNPLFEKYPPIPNVQNHQSCDGYSCMWCSRCPSGSNFKVPEEDREIYEKYLKELDEWWNSQDGKSFFKEILEQMYNKASIIEGLEEHT